MVTTFGITEQVKQSGPNLLGGKGAGLVEMTNLELPVPPGIIIPTTCYTDYAKLSDNIDKKDYLNDLVSSVIEEINQIVDVLGYMPLWSVRSGARVSMPGMMDTILNVGMNNTALKYWVQEVGETVALDCKRRFLQMYGNVVNEVPSEEFENVLQITRKNYKVKEDSELPAKALKIINDRFELLSGSIPTSLVGQLKECIKAVWKSWDSPRAVHYRKLYNYPDTWGTAVTIQVMVFGNMNDYSCSGVMFTRNPVTGDKGLYGDYLVNAQGEDVVAGIRDTSSIQEMGQWDNEVYEQLQDTAHILEKHYSDMMDVEFTVQDGILFILQSRVGKRSSKAALKIVADLVKNSNITLDDACKRLSVKDYLQARIPVVSPDNKIEPVCIGIPAGGGVVSGMVVFSSDEAIACQTDCILIRNDTTPDDIAGMSAAVGILTKTGGTTSHAAVVARSMNKACVVGAVQMNIGVDEVTFHNSVLGDCTVTCGDIITIDGVTGNIYSQEVSITTGALTKDIEDFVSQVLHKVNLLPIGKTKEEAFDNKLLIPYKFYGVGKVTEWVSSIKDAVKSGLDVYVDMSNSEDYGGKRILALFGDEKKYYLTWEQKKKILIEANVWDSITVWEDKGESSLEKFVSGYGGSLTETQMLKIFGTEKAYELIIEMMEAQGKTIPSLVVVSSVIQCLKQKFTKEV